MYNVFKRPMFKRGGPTQGTGIMSHVEPRVKAAGGYFPMPTQAERTAMLEAQGAAARNQQLQNIGQRFSNVGTRGRDFLSKFRGYTGLTNLANRIMPYAKSGAFNLGRGIGYLSSSPTALMAAPFIPPAMMAASLYGPEATKADDIIGMSGEAATDEQLAEAAKYLGSKPQPPADGGRMEEYDYNEEDIVTNNAANNSVNKNVGEKTDTTYQEADKRSRYQKEADEIMQLLKDEDLDKGQALLLISDALKQGGNISDKINYAVKGADKIVKRKAEDKKAARLLAYKTIKEEDLARLKAAELPGAGKLIQRLSQLQAVDPSKLTEQEKKEMNILTDQLKKEDTLGILQMKSYYDIYEKNRLRIPSLEAQISELQKKKKLNDEETTQLGNLTKELNTLKRIGQIIGFDKLALAKGGRVNYANGTEMDTTLESQNMPGDSNEFPTKTVEKLSFTELRNRLPKEITDDIVQLIANSEEALQEFAYIRTQQDINNFNVKYGVNLVLPPAKG